MFKESRQGEWLTSCSFEVACRIVALRDVDVITLAVFKWLIEWDGRAHEHLLNLAQAVKTWLELEVVVCFAFSDGRDNGNIITFGTDVVGRRNHGNIDVLMNREIS